MSRNAGGAEILTVRFPRVSGDEPPLVFVGFDDL